MKKIVSLMLVLAMLLSMVPAVFAAETTELISLTNESVTASGYAYAYTAETAGTLNVTMGTCSPGWQYTITGPDGYDSGNRGKWTAGETCDYEISAGDYVITIYAYTSADGRTAGTVSFTISFTPSEGGSEIVKSEYEVSETALALGDNTLTLLDTAVTTIYVFEPSETAVYTFTAPEGATLGYWGAGSWFLSDPGSTTNTYEWTCTGVGQSAYIGVSGVEGEFTLNVAKTGDYTVVETPIVLYENKAALEAFTIPTGANLGAYVDVYSETTHTAVYSDEDGYYHLDSVDGDVLLVDFNYADIVLSDALKSDRPVMYAYTTDEDGNDVKYDIGAAILEYEAVMDANGYYPVTEDVLLFYQVYAMGAGTFTFHLTGSNYNEECVWMYCMRTMNMDDVVIEPDETDPTDPSEPEETDPTDPSTPEESEPTVPSEPEESTEPSEPEAVNPDALISVTNEVVTATGYVFEYTAATSGTLHVSVGECSPGWRYKVFSPDGVESGYRSKHTAGTECDYYNVAGDWKIMFYAYDSSVADNVEGTVSFTVTFKPDGATEPTDPSVPESSEPETEPSEPEVADPNALISVSNEAVTTAGYVFEYTAATAGTLHVSVGECSPGWRYKVFSPDGVESGYRSKYTAGTECDYYNIAGDWKIVFYAYSSAIADNTEGTVSFTVTFTPDEQQGGEVEKTAYEVSTTELAVGVNSLTMLDTAVTSIFKFKPTEAGTYTITAPEGATAGNWGSNAYYLNDPGSTTNTCQWTCSSVGQSVFIGVSGIEGDFVLTIVKEVEETEPTNPSEPEETEPTNPSEPEETEPTNPSEPEETEPTDPSATEPSEPEVVDPSALISVTNEAVTATGYVFEYTAATSGTLHVSVGECSPGWRYKVFSPDGIESGYRSKYTAGTECDYYNVAGDWKIVFYAYSSTIADNTEGTVSFTVTFTPDESQGGEVEKTAYEVSDTELVVGENKLTMLDTAVATIFRFRPEAGTYTITAPEGAKVGNWGSISWSLTDPGSDSNVVQWTCTSQGQSAFIGVSGIEGDFVLTIVKEVEEPEPEPVYVAAVYINGQLVASYESVADAIAAAQGGYVKLLADVTEDITVSADLYLDLNGYSISGAVTVAEGATLYGMDSTTDDYDCTDGYGKITGTVTGNVASQFKSDVTGAIKRYVAITEETGVSFHRIYLGITRMSLKPGSVALGYRAVFAGDDVVKAALAETGAFGIKVWVDGIEDSAIVLSLDQADFVTGKSVSARIQDIDVENYGDTAICAEAFLTVGEETITSSTVSGSMKYMLETVNEKIDSYTAAQKTALAALVEQYYAVMKDWNVGNIYSVPDVDTPVEGSDPVE